MRRSRHTHTHTQVDRIGPHPISHTLHHCVALKSLSFSQNLLLFSFFLPISAFSLIVFISICPFLSFFLFLFISLSQYFYHSLSFLLPPVLPSWSVLLLFSVTVPLSRTLWVVQFEG